MGVLVEGIWHTDWYDTKSSGGKFKRQDSQFRNWIGDDDFPAQSGRYHLFVSLACPWAHRTLIFRKLKQLESHIGVTVVKPEMLDNGWELDDSISVDLGYDASPVSGLQFLYQLYTKVNPKHSGRVTVPVLWDKQRNTIVSNESAEIIRMLNSAFDAITGDEQDFYPERLRDEIQRVNEGVYNNINNGVYRCGFATTQEAYQGAFVDLFNALDGLETKLGGQPYLVGDQVTEADWRLFTTLVRFDAVYYGHFKCNQKRLQDYPNLSKYLRELYHWPGVAETVNFTHIKRHYYFSHTMINPTQIVPQGPELDYLL